jgi:hypothetical protein
MVAYKCMDSNFVWMHDSELYFCLFFVICMLNFLYEYVYLYNCILPVWDGSRSPMVRVWGKNSPVVENGYADG